MEDYKKKTLKEYFEKNELILFVLLLTAGFLLRWLFLENRPLAHDEGLFGIYAKYFYVAPEDRYYKYNPLLHGPLLFHVLPHIYHTLGMSKWTLRFLPALLGTFFMFMPYIFRRYLTKSSVIVLTATITLSPLLVYFSRYLRFDPLVFLFYLFALWGVLYAKPKYKSFFVVTSFVLQFCTKENAYITSGLLLFYYLFEYAFNKLFVKDARSFITDIIENIKKYRYHLLISILIAIFIYCYFYSAGFRYSEGILDGLYRKSLSYWLHQHNIERIKGPFIYNVLILSWYELFFMIAFVTQIAHFYLKRSWGYRLPILIVFILAITNHIIFREQSPEFSPIWGFFKLKIPQDFYPLFIIPMHAVLTTFYHLLKKQRALAFWAYLFGAFFFTYSYVGEKVPWLAQYPYLVGLIYMTLYFQMVYPEGTFLKSLSPQRKKQVIIAAFSIFIVITLRSSLTTSFAKPGKRTEIIGQVHTTQVYENIAVDIKRQLESPTLGFLPSVHIDKSNHWPATWWMFGRREYFPHMGKMDPKKFDYLLLDSGNYKVFNKLRDSHYQMRVPLRAWWVPDYKKMTWGNFFRYYFTHKPWSKTGEFAITVLIKKELGKNNLFLKPMGR